MSNDLDLLLCLFRHVGGRQLCFIQRGFQYGYIFQILRLWLWLWLWQVIFDYREKLHVMWLCSFDLHRFQRLWLKGKINICHLQGRGSSFVLCLQSSCILRRWSHFNRLITKIKITKVNFGDLGSTLERLRRLRGGITGKGLCGLKSKGLGSRKIGMTLCDGTLGNSQAVRLGSRVELLLYRHDRFGCGTAIRRAWRTQGNPLAIQTQGIRRFAEILRVPVCVSMCSNVRHPATECLHCGTGRRDQLIAGRALFGQPIVEQLLE